MITFTCYGTPIPKGSTKAFYVAKLGRAIVTADNRRSKPWQESITDKAREVMAGRPPLERETPVAIYARFFMPRPKSAPKRVTEHLHKPDLDKLLRLLKDGLTRAGVYHDDAQVVFTVASKDFAAGAKDPEGELGLPRVVVEVVVLQQPAMVPTWAPVQQQSLFAQRAGVQSPP